MSDNSIAEGLLLLVEKRKAEQEALEKAVKLSWKDNWDAIYAIRARAQEVCIHPPFEEIQKDAYDYHKREDWTTVDCGVCGKRLRRF